MLENIPLFFVMTLWSHVHTNCKITTASGAASHITLELYNSRVMRHMTPYRKALTNYAAILPMPINAANKHTFCAIGRGSAHLHAQWQWVHQYHPQRCPTHPGHSPHASVCQSH